MILTGGTLIAGATVLREAGATEVYACATHGLFSSRRVRQGREQRPHGLVTVTDTVAIDPVNRPTKVDVLPVSRLLAETIMNVFGDESVSAIFAGENQLF